MKISNIKKFEFAKYLKTLKPEDWVKKATSRWTIKDVVAHLIGWERDDVKTIPYIWGTKEFPWWKKTENYDFFNLESVKYYKNHTPDQLIEELQKWQNQVQKEIEKIGEDNLKKYPELFSWLFDNTDNDHYSHHYKQIKNTTEKDRF